MMISAANICGFAAYRCSQRCNYLGRAEPYIFWVCKGKRVSLQQAARRDNGIG